MQKYKEVQSTEVMKMHFIVVVFKGAVRSFR